MKRIGAFVLLMAAVVLLSGQAKGKDLQHLEVRSLTLKDAEGKALARFTVMDGTAALVLLDRNGKVRALLHVLADRSPGLGLYDKDGKTGAALLLLPDGSPALNLFDKARKKRAALAVVADQPALTLYDKAGTPRAVLDVDADDGSPSLTLFDAKGNVLWQAPR